MKDTDLKHMQTRLASDVFDSVQAQAKARGVSPSQWIRDLVTDAIASIEKAVEPKQATKAKSPPSPPVAKAKPKRVRPSRSKAAKAEREAASKAAVDTTTTSGDNS